MKSVECWVSHPKGAAPASVLCVDGDWFAVWPSRQIERAHNVNNVNRRRCTLPELLTEYLDHPPIVSQLIELTGYEDGLYCYRSDFQHGHYWICGADCRISFTIDARTGLHGFGGQPHATDVTPCTLAEVLTSDPGRQHAAWIHEFIAGVHAAVVTAEQEKPPVKWHDRFWLVWNSATGATQYRHKSLAEARKECEWLSREHTSARFYILEPVGGYMHDVVPEFSEIKMMDPSESVDF